MKTIFKYIFSVALGSIMLTSCDLDTIPTTYVDAGSVFGKTGDAEKVLNGGWNYLMETFNSYANPGYGAMLRANDAMGSDVVLNSKYGFRTHNEFSAIYGKGGTNTLSWLLAYRVINDCNGVLDNIDAAEGTQADRNRIKGQALALRGFLYLHLASCYSFAIDKDPDAVCAPVYTQSTDETIAAEGKPASSVSEVYAQSINDLEEALELIPETYVRDAKHKIDNEVVLGILSRACLYARQWEKAKTYSDKLLAKNNYLMTESEYKAGFNSVDNKEWIWGHAQTNDQSNASYQFHYLDTTTKGSYYYSFNVDPYFRDLFEDGDYRKEMLFWATDPGADVESAAYVWMRNSKFRFRDIENQLGDIVLMRVAEIYLINAEAKAHLNDPDAINKLNDLKTARGAKTINTNLSQQDLLETIWLERRKELWGEGFSLIDIIQREWNVLSLMLASLKNVPVKRGFIYGIMSGFLKRHRPPVLLPKWLFWMVLKRLYLFLRLYPGQRRKQRGACMASGRESGCSMIRICPDNGIWIIPVRSLGRRRVRISVCLMCGNNIMGIRLSL